MTEANTAKCFFFYMLVSTRNKAIRLIVDGGRRNHHPAASERNPCLGHCLLTLMPYFIPGNTRK